MKPKIILLSVFLVVILSTASFAEARAAPRCKFSGNTCTTTGDCCPVYMTDHGLFYGTCAENYNKVKTCVPVDGMSFHPDENKWCKGLLNANGSVKSADYYNYTKEYDIDFLEWNLSLLKEKRGGRHVCDLLFDKDIPAPVETGTFNYKYDMLGNLVSIANSFSSSDRNFFDYLNPTRSYATWNIDSSLLRLFYDGVGNLVKTIDAKNQKVIYEYDSYYRLKSIHDKDGGNRTDYFYDYCPNGVNRICRVEDSSGKTEYEYDGRGRVVQETKTIYDRPENKVYVTRFGYDHQDNIIHIINPNNDVTVYQYNSLSQLEKVLLNGVPIAQFSYNPTGTIKEKITGNVYTAYTYSPRDSLTSLYASKDQIYGPSLFARTYQYDPAGNLGNISYIVDLVNPGNLVKVDEAFRYDKLDRLTQANYLLDAAQYQYTYDPLGNRKKETINIIEKPYQYVNNYLIRISQAA